MIPILLSDENLIHLSVVIVAVRNGFEIFLTFGGETFEDGVKVVAVGIGVEEITKGGGECAELCGNGCR